MDKKISFTKKRYEIGNGDRYSSAFMKTCMENASIYQLIFKNEINKEKLISSIKIALEYFPLFKCKLIYEKRYLLEENDGDVSKVVKNCPLDARPTSFGGEATTDSYLFQISYFKNKMSFEWCHSVTDGRGSIAFLSKILSAYFDDDLGPIPNEFPLILPFETVSDSKAKSFGQIKQPKGFSFKSMPIVENGYKCFNHEIKINTATLLKFCKRSDSTPVSVLAPLLSKAIRINLPDDCKNKNVSCGIIVDGRKTLEIETMHNCVFNKVITYTDRLDKLSLDRQSTIYRGVLDLFTQKENLIANATSMVSSTDFLYRMKPLWLNRCVMSILSRIVKKTMNNFGITYIGKVPFTEKVLSELCDFSFCSWPDIGYCTTAISDLNGILTVTISENYQNKNVVESFISLCNENGIDAKLDKEYIFEQANVRL